MSDLSKLTNAELAERLRHPEWCHAQGETPFLNAATVAPVMREAASRLQAPAVAEVEVKPLEWDESEGSHKGQRVWSSGDPWVFWIVKNPYRPDYVWCENFNIDGFLPASPVRGLYASLDAAKAAAQSDYAARIRSALRTGGSE